MSTDIDSPWKEALDEYLEPCFDLLFPTVHADIDWSHKPEPKDKEFQKLIADAEQGRRYVDKLVQVKLKNGGTVWVLVHIEVQPSRDNSFEERMYVYNYRIHSRYQLPVASLAILADDDPLWRPTQYRQSILGCTKTMTFLAPKLLDWAPRWQELETHPNRFAKVVLAHLKTQETRNDPAARYQWKMRFVRALYEQGFREEEIRRLFRLIDWLMVLPPALKALFWRDLEQIQEERKMPFVSTPEWVYWKRGLLKGIKEALDIKFGDAGLALLPEIEQHCEEPEQLEAVLNAMKAANSPDELRPLWAPQS